MQACAGSENSFESAASRDCVLLLYWGRRGLSRFTYELAHILVEDGALVSVSRQNELAALFARDFGPSLVAVDTFQQNLGAAAGWRIAALRRRFAVMLARRRPVAVIDVMPHVWMPFVLPELRRAGVRYVPIAHDADVHPGDFRTRLAKLSMDHLHKRADHVVALSQTVADRLVASGSVDPGRLTTVFHPDLRFGGGAAAARPPLDPARPIRIAFVGRIMPYKGLTLFTDTVTRLRHAGLDFRFGVFGEGLLGADGPRLAVLGAEVVNHWLDDAELAAVLSRHDVLLASHVEASQSGVVAAALGAGLPVIATPVGGLVEQIEHGATGIIAEAATPDALAEAILRLCRTPGLYDRIAATIDSRREARSMERFAKVLREICQRKTPQP